MGDPPFSRVLFAAAQPAGVKTILSKNSYILTFITAAYLLAPCPSPAADMEGSRALAMGGAYSAVAIGPDTIRMNPAGIGQSRIYQIKAGYRLSFDDINTYNLSIVDFKTSSAPLGLSYTREDLPDRERNYGTLSFSNSGSATLIGLSIKYFEDTLLDDTEISYDLGVLLTGGENFRLSLVGKNLTKTDFLFVHKTYTAGLAYSMSPEFLISADYTKDEELDRDNIISALVLEYVFTPALTVRGGYSSDERYSATYYSAGLAIFDRTGYLEYGYRWNKDVRDDKIHSLAMSLNY